MKRKFISIMMTGILASSMSFAAFADATVPTTTTMPATTVTPVTTVVPVTEDAEELGEYKALLNKLESLKKQLAGAQDRLKKASKKDKKNEENKVNAFNKQIAQYQKKMKELLESQNKDDEDTDKYTEKQESYIDKIEAIIKKNNPTLQMVTAEKIVTDNPLFKSDLPLAVKDGIAYMSQSTLEKSFGVTLKYESTQKKFVSEMEGKLVEIFLLSNIIEIDGMPVKATAKPITIQENIYFPIKDLSSLLKIEYKWDNDLKVLTIDDLDIANPPVVVTPAPTPTVPTTPATTTTTGQ